jgi:hypothetical protein
LAVEKKNIIEKTTMFNKLVLLILGLALIATTACIKLPVATVTQSTTVPTIAASAATTQNTTSTVTQPTTSPIITTSSTATEKATSIQIPTSGVKQAGDLRVWILTAPNPLIRGSNTFEAFVIDIKGQPVSDAKLTFDFNMTNMNMGRNIVIPKLVSEGRYGGKVFFSMGGPWRVIISIERAGQTNTVRFDFRV